MFESFFKNRSAESDVREWLRANGYFGDSTEFIEIELHAIQRPGWLQIFRFEIKVKDENRQWLQLFGAMRSDERYGPPQIVAATQFADRDEQLAEWSKNLIMQHRHRN